MTTQLRTRGYAGINREVSDSVDEGDEICYPQLHPLKIMRDRIYRTITAFLYFCRNLRSQPLFAALRKHTQGAVLDVGGADFVSQVLHLHLNFSSWTILDRHADFELPKDSRITLQIGDGCSMPYAENSFDTVISVQVLEHVLEPNLMFAEMNRVLRPGATLIVMVPQTSTLHMAPLHFYNFTRYWLLAMVQRFDLEIVSLTALGGFWSTIASRLVYFPLIAFRCRGMTFDSAKRGFFFWISLPVVLLSVVLLLPFFLLFSCCDLEEEPNNHLLIARKKASFAP